MISVKESAEKEFMRLLNSEPSGTMIRIRVVGGGCSGLSYKLEFENKLNENQDKILYDGNFKIVSDNKSSLFVGNVELDYSGGLNGTGFQFNNPYANKTCGCGTSFSV